MLARNASPATEEVIKDIDEYPQLRLTLADLGLATVSRWRCACNAIIAGALSWLIFAELEPSLTISFFHARLVSVGLVFVLIVSALLTRLIDWKSIGLRIRWLSSQMVIGAMMVPLVFITALPALALILCFPSGRLITESAVRSDSFETVGSALWLAAIGALSEELIFRGILFPQLWRASGSLVLAIVLSSAFFSFMHGPAGIGIATVVFFSSIIWSVAFVRGGGLIAAATCHGLANLLRVAIAVAAQG